MEAKLMNKAIFFFFSVGGWVSLCDRKKEVDVILQV